MHAIMEMALGLAVTAAALVAIAGIWLGVLWLASRDQRVLDAVHVGIVREDQDAQEAHDQEVSRLVRARLARYDAAAQEEAWAGLEQLARELDVSQAAQARPVERPRLGAVLIPAATARTRITRAQTLWRMRHV